MSSKNKASQEQFVWTDDEAELLLNVTLEYKVKKTSECIDWESVKTKYEDILKLFQENLSSSEDGSSLDKDYPHKKESVTKNVVTTKLKSIRLKFRKAVDAGRRSGHGRVVLLYFELCEKIWGGAPATEQLSSGLETSDIQADNADKDHGDRCEEERSQDTLTKDSDKTTTGAEEVNTRRALLNEKLSGYKTEKLKRKLPVDTQLVACAKEELQIKRQLIDQMDQMEKDHCKTMEKLAGNLEKLTNSMSQGFNVLQTLMCQNVPLHQPYPHWSPLGTNPPNVSGSDLASRPFQPSQWSSMPLNLPPSSTSGSTNRPSSPLSGSIPPETC